MLARFARLLLLATCLACWVATPAWAAYVHLDPDADFTYYDDNDADSDPDGMWSATDDWLRVGADAPTEAQRSMLEFPIDTLEGTTPGVTPGVSGYYLHLYFRNFSGTLGDLEWTAYRNTGSAPWNNEADGAPTGTFDEWDNGTPDGTVDLPTPGTGVWIVIDATALVQAAFDAGSGTYVGFHLDTDANGQHLFASSDNDLGDPFFTSDKHPFLDTPEPGTLAVLSLGLGLGAWLRRRRSR